MADGRRREVHCLCSSSLPLHAPTRRGCPAQYAVQHVVRILPPARALHPAPCTGAGLSGSGAQGSIRSATLDGHTYAVKTFSRRAASAANTERSAVRAALACGAGARLGACTYAPLTHAHATSPPHRQQASRLGSVTPVHAHVTAVTHARALPSGEVQLFMEHGVCDLHTARCALPQNRCVPQAPAGSWPDAAGAPLSTPARATGLERLLFCGSGCCSLPMRWDTATSWASRIEMVRLPVLGSAGGHAPRKRSRPVVGVTCRR